MDYMIPRSEWGDGPWVEEPDHIEWRTLGLPCLIVRAHTGSLCGYVGLPPTHRHYARHYDRVPVDVHGGLTFSGYCQGRICHAAKRGETELIWWVGFDCAHFGDLSPAMEALHRQYRQGWPPEILALSRGTYKPVPYVRACVNALAVELAAQGPVNLSRERWWWWHVAQAKQLVRQDLPFLWKDIYLEHDRFGFSRGETPWSSV